MNPRLPLSPPTIFRYTLKELWLPAALSLLILTLILLTQQMARQADILSLTTAPFTTSAQLILLTLPSVLTVTLPFSLLISTITALNRLSSDSEMAAAQSAGISPLKFLAPLILLGLLGTTGTSLLTLHAIPTSLRRIRSLRDQAVTQLTTRQLRPQHFETRFPNLLLYLQNIDRNTHQWQGVFILKKGPQEDLTILTAQSGETKISPTHPFSIEAHLSKGTSLEIAGNKPHQSITSFDKTAIKLAHLAPSIGSPNPVASTSPQELPWSDLTKRAHQAPRHPQQTQDKVEWHKRIAVPLSCCFLVILAFPIGSRTSRHPRRTLGLAISFLIATMYYLLLIAGQNLSLSGKLPPGLGVWLANLCCLALASTLILSSHRQHQLPPLTSPQPRPPLPWPPPFQAPPTATASARPILNITNYLIMGYLLQLLALTVAILVTTSAIFTLFDLIPAITRRGITIDFATSYLLYLTPQLIYSVTPFALLIAILTAYNLLSRTNQLTAFQAAGYSPIRTGAPIFITTGATILMLFTLSEIILPFTNREQDARYHQIKGRQLDQATLAFGLKWVRASDNTIYSFQSIDRNNHLLNATAYKLDAQTHQIQEIIHLKEAAPLTAKDWGGTPAYHLSMHSNHLLAAPPPEKFLLHVPDGPELFKRTVNEASKMNIAELGAYLQQTSKVGPITHSLKIDLEKKKAFPLSCLTLAIISLPFALSNKSRRGALTGIGIGILIGLSFWTTTSLLELAGKLELLPTGWSVWGSQALFSAIGIFIWARKT
jgi:LPS export ABC transporter permease LptF/LPS export ABC transporter permease LptG